MRHSKYRILRFIPYAALEKLYDAFETNAGLLVSNESYSLTSNFENTSKVFFSNVF